MKTTLSLLTIALIASICFAFDAKIKTPGTPKLVLTNIASLILVDTGAKTRVMIKKISVDPNTLDYIIVSNPIKYIKGKGKGYIDTLCVLDSCKLIKMKGAVIGTVFAPMTKKIILPDLIK